MDRGGGNWWKYGLPMVAGFGRHKGLWAILQHNDQNRQLAKVGLRYQDLPRRPKRGNRIISLVVNFVSRAEPFAW